MQTFIILSLLCGAVLAAHPISTVSQHLEEAERKLVGLNFNHQELTYDGFSKIVNNKAFPIQNYLRGLSAHVLEAVLLSGRLRSREREAITQWSTNNIRQRIQANVNQSRLSYASAQISEALKDVLSVEQVFHQVSSVQSKIHHAIVQHANERRSTEKDIFFGSILAVILATFFVWMWWNNKFKAQSLTILLVIACLGFGTGFITSQRYWQRATNPLIIFAEQYDAVSETFLWQVYEVQLSAARNDIELAKNTIDALAEFNETVVAQLVLFTKRLATASNAGMENQLTAPELSLYTLRESQVALSTNKKQLLTLKDKYATDGSLSKERRDDIDQIIEGIKSFEIFFERVELDLYQTLDAGASVSEQASNFMKQAISMIKDGQLNNCIFALGTLEAEYERQMLKLNASSEFLNKASGVIKEVQREARAIQDPLSSEEKSAWRMKTTMWGALIAECGGGGAAAIASMAIPGGVLYLGATAASAIAAGITYQYVKHYDKLEGAARDAITLMARFADVTYEIDERVTSHRQVITLLMEDGHILLDNIVKAEKRFQQVRKHPSFADFEIDMLIEGTERVQESTAKMATRYRTAMESIYNRAVNRLSPN